MFGVIFIILGNHAGNAIAFGKYFMQMIGAPDHPSAVRALAVAVLTVACLIHAVWRRGGIMLNNILAFVKVFLLIAVIVIGFSVAGGADLGNGSIGKDAVAENLSTKKSFMNPNKDAGSYARSIVYIVYSYSGFKQPFYVSRVKLYPMHWLMVALRVLRLPVPGSGTLKGWFRFLGPHISAWDIFCRK